MEIVRKDVDLNLLLNTETDFQTNLGWEENLAEFETEILSSILNPIENYETVRFIHEPYNQCGITQTDIWFYFYFLTGTTYIQDYTPQGISAIENEHMLKQSTESFFRLEFFKTPGVVVSGTTLTCEPPTRQNRKLIFAKNLALPLGEKYFYDVLNGYIHLPVFQGSNYSNKENMYFFWFEDESVLTETTLSGTTTLDSYTLQNTGTTNYKMSYLNSSGVKTNIVLSGGTSQTFTGVTNQTFSIEDVLVTGSTVYHGTNTFFMTAKFFNAKDGTITDFANDVFSTTHEIVESSDMYYQVDIDKVDHSYKVYKYSGGTATGHTKLDYTNRIGTSCLSGNTITPIKFFEKGGGSLYVPFTPTPTPTRNITIYPTPTPTPANNLPAVTPTSTPLTPIYSYRLGTGTTSTNACNNYDPNNSNLYFSYTAPSGFNNGSNLYSVMGYPLDPDYLAPNGYYANSGYTWFLTSGVVAGYALCTYTPTPTPTPTQTNQSYGFNTGNTFTSSTLTCSYSGNTYPDGGYNFLPLNITTPTVGEYFYKDMYCTPGNTFVGNGNWYNVRQNSTRWAIQVSSGGQILGVVTCS